MHTMAVSTDSFRSAHLMAATGTPGVASRFRSSCGLAP
jgi:hypothetical protein